MADVPLDPKIFPLRPKSGISGRSSRSHAARAPRVLDQVGDKLELLELYEKLGLRFALLELEKDLPFLPLRDFIAFPRMVYPVFAGRPKSIKAIRSAMNRQLPIVMAAQNEPSVEASTDADIYRIDVVGNPLKVAHLPDGTLEALIECRRRVRVTQLIGRWEFMEARVEELTEPVTKGLDKTARVGRFRICIKPLQIAGSKPVNFSRLGLQPIGDRRHNCEWPSDRSLSEARAA